MNPFLQTPIRMQLVIIVLIVALPAGGIIVYSGAQSRKSSEAHALVGTQTLADVAASEQRLFTASAQQLLATLSELPQLSRKQADATSRFLARVHRLHPTYLNIFVADATGAIWASATPMEAAVNISDRRYFKNAITTGRFSSGEFQIGRISNKPTLHFGYPFWDAEAGRVGVIALGIPLETFQRLYDIAKIPAGGSLVLLDHKGTILFDSSAKANSGKPFHRDLFKKMQEGADAGTSTVDSVAGAAPDKIHYVSYRKLYLHNEPTPYLYIWVGIPAESALAEANRQIVKTVSAFSAVLAAALLAAWLVAERSIATRISALQRTSEKLAQGDLEARVPASVRGGDLGRLGEAFNVMAGRLVLREQLLLQREAELKKAQQLAQLGSWTYDAVSGDLAWSDELYRIYGVSRETFRPTIKSFLNLLHPDDRASMIAWIESCEAGNSLERLEFRIIRPDGAIRTIAGHGELQCSDGAVCTVSGTAQDITERKEIEAYLIEQRILLEQLNRNLEERVLAAVSELRKKDQMLIQQSRQAALGEMIGNIAHQWRQPLNTIGLVVQELEMTFGRPEFDREYLTAHVRKAMALVNHMSRTIDNFTTYFKPDHIRAKFNVNRAIIETLSLVEPSFTSSDISFSVTENDVLEVNGFGKEFSQVVLNIVFNARDAYRSSENAEKKTIEIMLYKEEDKAVVTIADHAGGIPSEIMDRIFDPYFTTKGPDKGTGIGLYMSKIIIEQHMGGRLTVRNVAGGAEFRIEVTA